MDYMIDAGTVKWAERRVDELQEAEIHTGCALELLEGVPKLLRASGDRMDNQPESDMVRAFADDLEKLYVDLLNTFTGWKRDKRAIERGIREFRKGGSGNDVSA